MMTRYMVMIPALALLAVACFSAITLPAAPAHAVRDHYSVPLMVIRFNQPRVHYKRPLFNAVSRAIDAKQDVHFNVINYYPTKTSQRLQNKAKGNLKKVSNALEEMGVPRKRINIANKPADDLKHAEVHIYVR